MGDGRAAVCSASCCAAALSDFDDIWDDDAKGPKPPMCTTDAVPMRQFMRDDARAVWNDYRRMIGKPIR